MSALTLAQQHARDRIWELLGSTDPADIAQGVELLRALKDPAAARDLATSITVDEYGYLKVHDPLQAHIRLNLWCDRAALWLAALSGLLDDRPQLTLLNSGGRYDLRALLHTRGLRRLRLDDDAPGALAILTQLSSIRELALSSRSGVETDSALRALQVLPLESLSLERVDVRHLALDIPTLKTLRCSGCKDLETLSTDALPTLTELHVKNCAQLTALSAAASARLEVLVCSDSHGLQRLALPDAATPLRELDLAGCPVPLTSAMLGRYRRLERLSLERCAGLTRLELSALHHLHTLKLGERTPTEAIVLRDLPALRELRPDSNGAVRVELSGVASLTELCLVGCEQLERLTVSGAPQLRRLSCAHASSLRELVLDSSLLALETLDLTSCEALTVLELRGHPALSQLEVCGCEALQRLVLSDLQLEELELDDSCTALVVLALQRLPVLTALKLESTPKLSAVTLADVPALTELHIWNSASLMDLSFLTAAPALGDICLSDLPDGLLAPLASLPALTKLHLTIDTAPFDLLVLASLTGLEELSLQADDRMEGLGDIGFIAHMPALRELSLADWPPLAALPSLSHVPRLRSLTLPGGTAIRDLSALAGLTTLEALDLSDVSGVTSLAPLAGLTKLRGLRLSSFDAITDLTPLAGLRQLRSLQLYGEARVEHLAPLSQMTELQFLNLPALADNVDLIALRRLKLLSSLSISGAEALTDIAPLAALTKLEYLMLLRSTCLTDITRSPSYTGSSA